MLHKRAIEALQFVEHMIFVPELAKALNENERPHIVVDAIAMASMVNTIGRMLHNPAAIGGTLDGKQRRAFLVQLSSKRDWNLAP